MHDKIPLFQVFMAPSAPKAAEKILKSGYIGQGTVVEDLEKRLRVFLSSELVLTTNSATSAEHIAIHMLKTPDGKWTGWERGDEILLSPMTCTATTFPAMLQGMKPHWVDIDETMNMCLDDLRNQLSPKTKIIMPVLWGGMPLDMYKMEEILDYAEGKFGFRPKVIWDCAHAMGSTFDDANVCNFPGIFTYSMQAIKHVTSVEGGVLVVHEKKLFDRAKLLRWYGLDREKSSDMRCGQAVAEIGYKMNQVDPNAAVGIENLLHAQHIIGQHRYNAHYYYDALKDVDGLRLVKKTDGGNSSWWVFTILVERYADFVRKMSECGIMTSRVHERNDIYPVTAPYKRHLPNLDRLDEQRVCIPVGWWVLPKDREYIVDCIKSGW